MPYVCPHVPRFLPITSIRVLLSWFNLGPWYHLFSLTDYSVSSPTHLRHCSPKYLSET